ncbi:MAG: cation-translocating P-type ATPase [Planctomycetia bacterium]|nr:cation-translocating P-type ATPase [Planctomycetia bacterium]
MALLLGIYGVATGTPGELVFQEGFNLLDSVLLSFVVAVTIIVVAVPEGLPMMVTVSLALNMMKMARQNCLVRKLVASETIGSATVICTDKTGTLTENRMTPVWAVLGAECYSTLEAMTDVPKNPNWERLVAGISVNSSADLNIQEEKDGSRTIHGIGNPTECALLKFLDAADVSYAEIRGKFHVENQLGHNSQRKMSAATVLDGESDTDRNSLVSGEKSTLRTFIKGAPERILARCSRILVNGTVEEIGPYRERLENWVAEASARALRVLAFCEAEADWSQESALENAAQEPTGILTGIIGIADPLRAEVPPAVAQCAKAGIVVKMVTGDALPTARAIAREAGIYTGAESELVMTSDEFNAISDADLPEKARALRVLARSTPADKLRLVKALHHDGDVVAMTGDGTNDAPALKFADVGLAMGQTGTEVAKEASDIVLVDDNFKNIVTGVLWGRTLFQNIQRFLQFQLSVNAVALLCAVIGPCVGVPLPLTVTQLLWINIIMDTFAAIAYSTQPPRVSVLNQPPIPRDSSIITAEMMINIVLVGIYQTVMLFAALFGGWFVDAEHVYDRSISALDPSYLEHNLPALTIFFTMLVMFQFWHKFNCRSLSGRESAFADIFKCRGFLSIVLMITVTQIILVQVPQVGIFFRTQPLTLLQWGEITLLTSSVLVVGWIARKIALFFSRS